MLTQLQEFRNVLDALMIPQIKNRIVLYGYGYTGRFLQWYAEYYHGIHIDYIVSLDMTTGHGYEQEIFREDIFSLDFKDILQSKVWMGVPLTNESRDILLKNGYSDENIVDFYNAIYGNDIHWNNDDNDIFGNRKTGLRDIQFLEYLEWKYGCNFLSMVDNADLIVAGKCGSNYRATTQKELFTIFDKCHIIPSAEDRIFDFGCGKGAAVTCFLDYGFVRGGGIEYEPQLYSTFVDNMKRLGISSNQVECLEGDAAELETELDKYNWFYFWAPFDEQVFKKVIVHLEESVERRKRNVHIIYSNPQCHELFDESKVFKLTNQFTIPTRQRVVNVYKNLEGAS